MRKTIEELIKDMKEDIKDLKYQDNTKSGYLDLPLEFDDYKEILEHGAAKHGSNNWLEPNGSKSSFKEMHDSMFHHLAESFAGQRVDHESGLDPLLHLITRAQMMYTRLKRNIKHENDK